MLESCRRIPSAERPQTGRHSPGPTAACSTRTPCLAFVVLTSAPGSRKSLAYSARDASTKASSSSFSSTSTSRGGFLRCSTSWWCSGGEKCVDRVPCGRLLVSLQPKPIAGYRCPRVGLNYWAYSTPLCKFGHPFAVNRYQLRCCAPALRRYRGVASSLRNEILVMWQCCASHSLVLSSTHRGPTSLGTKTSLTDAVVSCPAGALTSGLDRAKVRKSVVSEALI